MKRSEDIRKTIAREETIVDTIKKRKLRLFGHICRMNDNRLIKHTIFAKIDGKPRKVAHVDKGWTTSRTGVDAADRTCFTWRKTDACGRN